ncbi:hypothetical protein [Chromobacterium haemolyticum]|uniref:hypothetical protein n=1 Tax=Chromobacterium haemolyticum TaxID=394935 RepID=UPI0009D96486|nr:hypothetical protein [Chromobacterium haemolyticum]OQS44446.1 hypothetical protein B0T39_01570 [Chromobacterium haemolyticum]
MSEPSKPKEPDWSGLNLPVLTEVVDESQVPTLGDEVIDIPDFDFSSELDALADQLGQPPQDLPAELEIPELSLEELIAAPVPGEEPLLDLASLPSLDLDDIPASELGIEQVLPGWSPAVASPEAALPAAAEAGDFEFLLQPVGEEPPTEALADEFAPIAEEAPAAMPDRALDTEPLVAEAEPVMEAALAAAESEPVGTEIPDAEAPPAVPDVGAAETLIEPSAPTPFTSISLDSLPTGVLGGGVGPETQVDSLLPSWPESSEEEAAPVWPESAEAPAVGLPDAAADDLEQFAPLQGESAVEASPEMNEPPVPAFDVAPAVAPEAIFESAEALPDAMISPESAVASALAVPGEEPLLAEIDQALAGLQTEPVLAMPEAVEAEAHEPPATAEAPMMDVAFVEAAAEPVQDEALEPQAAELEVPQLDAGFAELAEAEAAAEPVQDEALESQAAELEVPQLDAGFAEPAEAEAAAEPVQDEALEPQAAELEVPQLDAGFAEPAEAEAAAEPVQDEALEPQAAELKVPQLDAGFAEPAEAEAAAEPVLDEALEPQAAELEIPQLDAGFAEPAEAEAAAEPVLDEALEPQAAELEIPQLDAGFAEPAEAEAAAEPVLDEALELQAAELDVSHLDAECAEPAEAEAAAAPVLDEALEPQATELDVPHLDAVFAEPAEAEATAEPVLDEALESLAVEPEVPQQGAGFAEPAEVEAVAEPVLDQMLEPQAAEPAMPLADVEPESLALAEGEIPELTVLESEPETETETDGMGAAELAAGAGALAAAGLALAAGAASSGEPEREAVSDGPTARGVEVLKVSEVASAAAAAAMMSPQAVNAPPGTVAVIDEQALLQSMYEKMLPRMKVELSLWLQDALELQAKQMLSGVMHQLKEDYEMLFGEALKESLRQTINSLGKIEKDGKRDE